jgi:spectrin beta
VYVVLSSNVLQFYKDQKHARADPKGNYRSQIDLEGTTAVAATDYNKRPNVFRLKLANGGDYLFQSKDEDEMNNWISRINAASGADAASSPSRAQTMPATVEGGHRDEPKKRSFFTLGKKK